MKILIPLLLLLLTTSHYYSTTFYVAKNGNDSNIGSESLPWLTIQKAANSLITGDSVLVKSGTYNERVIVQNSGTLNHFIVFSNYQNDVVTIDGNNISWGSSWNGLFDVSDKNYIEIKGFRILNADYAGIWTENSAHIRILNNYTYNTFSSGIGIWDSNNISIQNNEVELACNDGGQECITLANSFNCQIFENNVHHNGPGNEGGEGIDAKAGSHDINIFENEVHHLNSRLGIYADAWDLHTYNINIYNNIIHHCSESGLAVASENGGLIEYVNIYNNIIYHNQYGGIELGNWSDVNFPGPKPIKHIKIINNTCYKNGDYNNGWGYGIVIDNPNATDIIIRNNICSENSAQLAIQQIGTTEIADHNLIFGNNIATGTIYGSDSIVSNPLFVDANNFNFHLQNNSPAIDKGNSLDAPSSDFENNNRPLGLNFDIGAFEYNPILNINTSNTSNELINIYPNPVFDQFKISIPKNRQQTYTLELFDINGKLVKKEKNKMQNEFVSINRKKIASGIYTLSIRTSNNTTVNKKLIIE